MSRPKMRFVITSTAPGGNKRQQHSCDDVVTAWDWYAWFTGMYPLDEVTIVDREADVEART